MRSFLCQLWTLDSFIWTLSISSAATRSKVSTTRNGTKRCFWSNWVLFRLARHEVSQQRGESQRGFSFSLLQFVAGNWMRRVIWSPAGRGSCNAMPGFCRRQSNKQIEKSNWWMLISKTYRWTELYQGTRDEKGKVNLELSRISCCVFFLAYFAMSPN